MADQGRASGYVDPNFSNPMGPNDATIIIYGYTPSLVLASLGCILFTLLLIAHTIQIFRYKTWYFIPMLVGCAMEIGGYVARALSSRVDPYSVTFFVVQYFLIVVAPVFYSAALYTILNLMIRTFGREFSILGPKKTIWIFVTCDVIATIVQIAGAALIGAAESNRKSPTTPNNILLAGLVFQSTTFLIFDLLFASYVYKSRNLYRKSSSSSSTNPTNTTPATISFPAATAAASTLIYLRTLFRLAETAQGIFGWASTHEAMFGALEFAPVVLAVGILAWWYPGAYVGARNRDGGVFGGGDGEWDWVGRRAEMIERER